MVDTLALWSVLAAVAGIIWTWPAKRHDPPTERDGIEALARAVKKARELNE